MRIRTQFIVTMSLFGIILLIIAGSVVLTNQQMERLDEQEEIALKLERGAGELSYLSNDYLLYRESRQLSRWEAKWTLLYNELERLSPGTPEERVIVDNIKANHRHLKGVFDNVSSIFQDRTKTVNSDALHSLTQVSWSRMAVQNQGIMFDALQLSQAIRNRKDQLKQTNSLLIFGLLLAFSAYFTANYLMVQRRLLKSIADLQAGTKVVGSGNLDFAIGINRADEIGDLSRAFNQMTADLKSVTASKAELETEVSERKRAESAIKRSNERLGILAESARLLLTSEKPEDIVQTICSRVMAHLDCQVFFNYLVNEKAGRLHLNAYSGIAAAEAGLIEWLDYGVAVCGCVARDGIRIVADHIATSPDERTALVKSYGVNAYCCHPLLGPGGTVIGTLSFGTCSRESFNEEDISLMKAVTDQVATAMVRKSAEEKISHLASFPEMNPNPIVELDPEGNVLYVNPATREQFPELLATGISHSLLSNWEAIKKGFSDVQGTFLFRETKTGGRAFYQTVYYAREMNLIRIYHVDITERKKAEEDVLKLNRELKINIGELAATNRELESFSYSVSHDLRAPLRHLTGFSELLRKRAAPDLDEKSLHYLDVISTGALKMGRLIDDLLEFSRTGRVEMKKQFFDLDLLLKEVISTFSFETKGRDIVWNISPLREVYGDPALLKLVWTNLISNALKFTRPRERVSVGINMADNNDEQVFSIKDNGVGFDMKYAEKLFGIFQRLHSTDEFEGTGIGLAGVQRIIHRHGGRIWVEAAPGQGAAFFFALPQVKK